MNELLTKICAALVCVISFRTLAETTPAKELFHARFRSDSSNNTYAVGAKGIVEASVTDQSGNVLTNGIVEIWADDGWTNVLWRTTLDLAKTPTAKKEFSRKTPGSIRFHAKGLNFARYHDIDRIIFGVDDIKPLTPFPDDFEEYWRSEQNRLAREVPFDVEKTPARKLSTKDSTVYRVSFPTFNGKRIYGLLSVPKGGGRHPAIINVPGAGPGWYALRSEITRKGWITLDRKSVV